MSAKFTLTCEQATTFNFQFTISNNSSTGSVPWNLTGYTGTMTVRPFAGASTTTGDIAPGRYQYDLVLDSGATITRILEGKFVVTAAVTTS